MGLLSAVKQSSIVHAWLFCVFLISALVVTTCQCFTVVVWPFSKQWYRSLNGHIINLLWLQLVWLTDYWSGSKVHFHAEDDFLKKVEGRHALLVVNHKQDVDWLVIWQLAERFKMMRGAKCLMKNEIKYVPFFGWSFYLTEQLFVNRNYAKDKTSLMRHLKNITTYHFPTVTLIFCEGTRYTKEKYEKSQEFAKQRGLPGLKHHLLPRTKGFNLCIEAYKGKVPVIYNTTIAYQDNVEPSIYDLICGKQFDFHVFVRVLPLDEVPTDSEDATAEYCHELYRDKDRAYEYFLEHNTFTGFDPAYPERVLPPTLLPLYVMSFWMLLIGAPLAYYAVATLFSGSALLIVAVCAVCYAVLSFSKSLLTVTVSSKGSTYGGQKDRRAQGDGHYSAAANGGSITSEEHKKET
ncbi:1-acyl-sn-glycerol-3-phosphate acyltransferase gamma-like [Diadema setosum]|uniref:1-acyl-sn-glycerol-3-phosphate acyltransferase gamma-like n=1 Tax=Diadema setosum TaxID=31175 RepID=UPI003B3ACCB9